MDIGKKLKVYEVSKELFERFGFKKTTVDEIAAGCGISKRTLYNLFDSKEKILSELVIHEALLLKMLIHQQIDGIDDPLKKLETFTKMGMDYFDENLFMGKVLGGEADSYLPLLKQEIKAIEEGIEEIFLSILIEGTQQKVFRKMDHKASANCVFILFRSFTYAKKLEPNQAWVQFIRNAILNDNLSNLS